MGRRHGLAFPWRPDALARRRTGRVASHVDRYRLGRRLACRELLLAGMRTRLVPVAAVWRGHVGLGGARTSGRDRLAQAVFVVAGGTLEDGALVRPFAGAFDVGAGASGAADRRGLSLARGAAYSARAVRGSASGRRRRDERVPACRRADVRSSRPRDRRRLSRALPW